MNKISPKISLSALKKELTVLGTPERAKACAWFFKTGPGQYGEGDVFLGLTVPDQRKVARKYKELSLPDIEKLLHSKEHEFRLTALIMLVDHYKSYPEKRKQIFNLYLANTTWINNWDLVDTSAGYIVGDYLYNLTYTDKAKKNDSEKIKVLTKLAHSTSLWERRIAIVATHAFIQKGMFEETIAIATILLHDSHDLIQKATGWMLREMGKRASLTALLAFLHQYGATMPRTTLRYSIEKFSPAERKMYLNMKRK